MTVERIRSPHLPAHLNGWILSGTIGVPRFWAMVWETLQGAGLSASTLSTKLLAIDRLYRSVHKQTGSDCLDQLLANGDHENLEACLEGFLVQVRNSAAISRTDRSHEWRTAVGFVRDIAERISRTDDFAEMLARTEARMQRMERLYASLRVGPKPKFRAPRALPVSVVENLYEITDPASARNPFRSEAQRWRNYVLLLLYLHQGLRRGEALILPVDAIKEDFDVELGRVRHWLDVTENEYEDNDPRYTAPAIKTRLSHRQIPLTNGLAHIIRHYINNFRGKQNYSFLFTSNRHQPLALPSVNMVFDRLSETLSPGARKDLKNHLHAEKVTPHDCRHTCAVVRLAEFVAAENDMEVALQNMRVFFGWSKESEMPRHYARAFFENRLVSIWQRKFDDRVDTLRALRAVAGGTVVPQEPK